MLTKLVVAFGILALVAATAGSIPVKGSSSKVTLSEPAVISGTAMKAGDYRVTVSAGKVTFFLDKESREFTASVETGQRKFDTNEIQYDHAGSLTTIKEICLGGTKTRLIFN